MKNPDGYRTLFRHSFACRTAALCLVLIPALSGCRTDEARGDFTAPAAVTEPEVEVELASLMGEMQRHSAKLGYAIGGRNRPLASFYLVEVNEVLDELLEVEEDDGMPIAHPAGVILTPALAALAASLEESTEWPPAWEAYEAVIGACNRCHNATEHEFIEILPATGVPPFNQRFEATAAR